MYRKKILTNLKLGSSRKAPPQNTDLRAGPLVQGAKEQPVSVTNCVPQ